MCPVIAKIANFGRPILNTSGGLPMKVYNCLECGAECKWGHSKTNKFCNNTCQAAYKWKNETVPRIEGGTRSDPSTLKKYLVEKRGNDCEECGQGPIWNGKPLILQLDHIDGNSDDNRPSNIRLLCPSCHSQTDTFAAKGQGSRYLKKNTKRNKYLQQYKTGD
jgi:hypothetical protein